MRAQRLNRLAALAGETAFSLLLVLALYWLFMTFLYALFPSGTPLREVMGTSTEELPKKDAAGRRPEAALRSVLRDVRFRRGNSVAWGSAREGMLLYDHDAVQTFERSGATVSFAAADYLLIGSNSMVVLSRLDQGGEGGARTYRVQVEGDLSGTLSRSKGVRMELAAAGHVARLVPGAARFRVTPNGSDSASLAVYSGEARVQGRDGTVRVPAHYGVTLRRGAPVGPAVPLPEAPALKDEKLLYKFRLLPPKVRFTWGGGAGEYRFQLARDPRFAEPLLDRKVAGPEFVTGTLEAGSYYWRVSRIRQGTEGAFSRAGQCELRQLLKPPELSVEFPPQECAAGSLRLAGRAEPGCKVFINGAEVAPDGEGAFVHELTLRPGVNLIRVEALDPAGNASYASRIVYGSQ